jgi:hypothetical protein
MMDLEWHWGLGNSSEALMSLNSWRVMDENSVIEKQVLIEPI